MSPGAGSVTDRSEVRRPGLSDRLGTGVCAIVLVLGAFVTGYVVVTGYVIEPDGPWDQQAVTNSRMAAGLGLAFCALTALLTWVFAKAGWTRRWWYALPAACGVAALLRLTLLAP